MNEYKMVIDFQRKIIFPNEIDLVVNDYNSTKLTFEFNQEAEKYLFKCLLSDESIYVDEIKNNELLLPKGLLQKEGLYKYQISAYGDDNRLTTYAEGILKVRNELVSTDEIVPLDDRVPILDKLINEVDSINIDVEKVDNVATVTLINKDGASKEVKIYDGEKGETGPRGEIGPRGPQGEQGIQGPIGLTGPQGIQGEQGPRGLTGPQGIQGKTGPQGVKGDKGNDAKINGVNTLNILAGENITLQQSGSNLTINATGGSGGTSDYNDLTNKPLINDIELDGSLTSHDLGIINEEDVGTIMNDVKYNYVKDGLVNNTNTLSDEEQLKIEQWLGLDQNYITFSNTKAYTPSENYNPTPKKYVDDADSALRERISEIELSKFPNATIIGTPTIQQGQVSNFSLNNYMEFPFLVDFRGNPFEINFAFTTGQDIDNQQNILDSDFGLAFAIRNKHLILALSFNGTSWATEQTGTLTLQPQITYRIKITWNRLLYKVSYSIDGGNTYIDDITFGATQAPYPRQMYIGVGKLAQNYFKGIINMNYADVYINGNKIWMGMDDAGLSLRMSVSMDNIDELGVAYINSLIDAKIGNIDTVLQQIDTGSGV